MTSVEFDYTVVALAPSYGVDEAATRGWFRLRPRSGKALVGERVNILQHPNGEPLQASLRSNRLVDVVGAYLHYESDTEPGSSGAPVCNDQWELAALHRSGVPKRDGEGRILLNDGSLWSGSLEDVERIEWVANEGVRVSQIVADVRERLPDLRHQRLFAETELGPPDRGVLSSRVVRGSPRALELAAEHGRSVEVPLTISVRVGAGHEDARAMVDSRGPALKRDSSVPEDDAVERIDSVFECVQIYVSRSGPSRSAAADDIKRAAIAAAGQGWEVVACEDGDDRLLVELETKSTISIPAGWEVVHALRSALVGQWSDAVVEPCFEADLPIELPGANALPSRELVRLERQRRRSVEPFRGGDSAKDWSTRFVSGPRAWELSKLGQEPLGRGVIVGHPDSGYTNHSELLDGAGQGARLLVERSVDFVDPGRPNALDKDGFHGTSTASVIMSGHRDGIDPKEQIMGMAPEASLIPYRVAQRTGIFPAPVLFRSGARRLAKAIAKAREDKCDVISISLGWFKNEELHHQIKQAHSENIIIIAAAGQYTRAVVWPGFYLETICMAGCDSWGERWRASSRGPRVDFTGPAYNVWTAGWRNDDTAKEEKDRQGKGTSQATATTAGIAALWLAHHGKKNLLNKYQPAGVPLGEVFRWVLLASSDPAPLLNGKWGLGTVNAAKALEQRLPKPSEIPGYSGNGVALESATPNSSARSSVEQALAELGIDAFTARNFALQVIGQESSANAELPDDAADELAYLLLSRPRMLGSLQSGPPALRESSNSRLGEGMRLQMSGVWHRSVDGDSD